MYKPCSFDRKKYLENSEAFKKIELMGADSELCEFSDDAEDLAYELAYTRYALAKAEEAIKKYNEIVKWGFKYVHNKNKPQEKV